MDDQQVQQGHELDRPLASSSNHVFIPLPLDFWENSIAWLTAAGELVEFLPNLRDDKSQAQTADRLGEIIRTIDDAMESVDPNDALLQEVFPLLLHQSLALELRHLVLQDPDDFRRAVYILEILPQFCDPTDTESSQTISGSLSNYLGLATTCFLKSKRPSVVKMTQLLESFGIPANFLTQAKFIVTQADDISDVPVEVRSCGPQSPIIRDVDWVIATIDNVTGHCNSSGRDPDPISSLLSVQAAALGMRFRLLGNTADLDRFAHVSEIAPPDQFHNPTSYLSSIPSVVYCSPLDDDYLDKSIAFGEELLLRFHDTREPATIMLRLQVARLYMDRFRRRPIIGDGERILQLCQDTLPLVSVGGRSLWLGLRGLIPLPLSLICHGPQFPELSQSLQILDESTHIPFVMKANFLWSRLRNAAVAGDGQVAVFALSEIHARGYAGWEPAIDMFQAEPDTRLLAVIEALKQKCTTYSRDEQNFKPFAVILVIALWWRYHLSGDTGSAQGALALRSRLGPPGMYGFDFPLYSHAAAGEFNGVGMRPEFAKVLAASSGSIISQYSEAPEWENNPERRNAIRPGFYTQLDRVLFSQTDDVRHKRALNSTTIREGAYLRYCDDESFHVTHRELLLQLSVSKNDPGKRWPVLTNLGALYKQRFTQQRETNLEDLQYSVDWYQKGVDTVKDADQTLDAWRLRTSWAISLFRLHKATNSVEHSCLIRAHDYFRQAAASTHWEAKARLSSLSLWISYLPGLEEEGMKHASNVCQLMPSLLEEQCWTASSPRLSINTRHEIEHQEPHILIIDFALRLIAGTNPGGVTKALGLIEASQASVWGQLHRLRVPLGDLEAVSPSLASRFQRLSISLQRRMGLLDDSSTSEEDSDAGPPWMNPWQLNQDMNRVIEEIRAIPRFEGFLRRRSFEQNELRKLAKDGPVVLLLDPAMLPPTALILHHDRHDLIKLPLTREALLNLHRSFRFIANARDDSSHEGPSVAEDPIDTATCPGFGPSNRAGVRVVRKKGRDISVEDLLEILWLQVVEPVLDVVLCDGAGGKGKSKVREIPELKDRQRIWWCCLGEFSFLPIHAAGIYAGGSSICLSDFFLSSYTPTLTALLDARERTIPSEVRVLAAAQPNPGGRWKRLAQVQDELREIVQATPSPNLVLLGGTNQPDFDGHHTSVENILKSFPEASVLHLACHGTQNITDPLSSGFILANGKRLTIEELLKCRLPNAHTAILSACHTASNDVEQPEEVVNLSSALIFLGFSSILATKWPMNDFDGPVIAKVVYQTLFDTTHQSPTKNSLDENRPQTLASFSPAKVVDDIARRLREKKVPAKRWATFVHVGV